MGCVLTKTVHVPQSARPQPNFVPVSPSSVRRIHRRRRSWSTLTRCGCPFSVNAIARMMAISTVGAVVRRPSAETPRQDDDNPADMREFSAPIAPTLTLVHWTCRRGRSDLRLRLRLRILATFMLAGAGGRQSAQQRLSRKTYAQTISLLRSDGITRVRRDVVASDGSGPETARSGQTRSRRVCRRVFLRPVLWTVSVVAAGRISVSLLPYV